MLKLIPDYLKIKAMCKNAVRKLPLVTISVSDRCKTQEMCDKVILEHGGLLRFISDCCKNQNYKAADNLSNTLELVTYYSKTQKVCDKAVYACPSLTQLGPEC